MMLKSNQVFALVLIFNLLMIGEAQSGVGNCDIVADDNDDYRACLRASIGNGADCPGGVCREKTNTALEWAGVLAGPIAYLGGVALSGYFQNKSVDTYKSMYALGQEEVH